jgi:hypothetical protein
MAMSGLLSRLPDLALKAGAECFQISGPLDEVEAALDAARTQIESTSIVAASSALAQVRPGSAHLPPCCNTA